MEKLPTFKDYEAVRFLGRGGEGRVYAVRKTGETEEKALKRRPCLDIQEANDALQEVLAMSHVGGICNVKIWDVFLDGGRDDGIEFYLNIVMELCKGGDLQTLLHGGRRDQLLSPNEINSWLFQILSGLDKIHRAGFVHRDLKPENLLLTESLHLKIGDFGLAAALPSSLKRNSGVEGVDGTYFYMAPEVLSKEGATEKSDVFSAGCILYEMMSGLSLVTTKTAIGMLALSKGDMWDPKTALNLPSIECSSSAPSDQQRHAQLLDICAQMLRLEPEERPLVSQLLENDILFPESTRKVVGEDHGGKGGNAATLLPVGEITVRPLKKGEEKEAASVLAKAYEYDPRFYYWTYEVEQAERLKITKSIFSSVVKGALLQKAAWCAIQNDRMCGVMILMSPEDKKRPPVSVLLTSGWKLAKYSRLLLPAMRLYGTAMKEVDRVFTNQLEDWFLVNLGVLPAFQGRGVARTMMQMVLKWATEQNTAIDALVFHRRQLMFLEKYGFKAVSKNAEKNQPTFYCSRRNAPKNGISITATSAECIIPVSAVTKRFSGQVRRSYRDRDDDEEGTVDL